MDDEESIEKSRTTVMTSPESEPPVHLGKKRTVFLVDDHPILRHGVAALIDSQSDLEVIGEAATMADAYSMISANVPDLAVIDITLDGNNGLELMKGLVHRWPDLLLLAYSMHDEEIYAERVLLAGAKGYVTKHSPSASLLEAIRTVLRGEIYLSKPLSKRLLGKSGTARSNDQPFQSPIEKLSDRELEVLECMGKGLSASQIAESLCVSIKTIETHKMHLKQKLNLQTGAQLTIYAMQWKLGQS
jgi:DNA-binding NarL/FixJ family response regulator